MKVKGCLLKIFFSLSLVTTFLILKQNVNAEETGVTVSEPYVVTFHTTAGDVEYTFGSLADPIGSTNNHGEPLESGNARYLTKKYFLGWSSNANYETTDGAKLYYKSEPAQNIFNDNVTDLYPVYISQMNAMFSFSESSAYISKNVVDRNIMPDSTLQVETEENQAQDHHLTVYFDEEKDNHNVMLESSFELNKMTVHWLYTGNGASIMTNTQTDEAKGNSEVGAPYTHVDLNLVLPEEIDLSDALELTFSSYYFEPYMVINTDTREKHEISEVTSNEKWNITELVSDTNPSTTFTIKNPTRKITLRAIVRTNYKLNAKQITNIDARTVENTLMTAVVNNPVFISKENAKTMVDEAKTIKIEGVVNGYVKLPWPFNGVSIPDIEAQDPIFISFKPLQVTFNKNTESLSDTSTQDLGLSIVGLNGTLADDSFTAETKPTMSEPYGQAMPDDLENLVINGKTYIFKGWNTAADGSGESFTKDTIVTEDMTVYAIFEEKVEPIVIVETPTPNLEEPKQVTAVVPKTADSTTISNYIALMLIAGILISASLFTKKKHFHL